MTELSQDLVADLFEYKDGFLFWKISIAKNISVGQKAGGVDSKGRWRVGFGGKNYQAHRIIFLLEHGYLPQMIDHIDGNPLNNTIENLRSADFSSNGFNRKINANNSSGVKGLTWSEKNNKWQTSIKLKNKTHYFGHYAHKDIAETILFMARKKLHGEYMRSK